MFKKGSRYYSLPQSRHLTAAGEWLLSTDLRFTARVQGQFLHMVNARERLDLLAFRYYNDPRKWWLIADANPDKAFPLDLLDASPMVEEELVLEHFAYLERVAKLMLALRSVGSIVEGRGIFFVTSVIVEYVAAPSRALIIDEIVRTGFQLIDSTAWAAGASTVEVFRFEDRKVKQSWNALVGLLGSLPGVLEATSVSAGATLRIRYNEGQLSREALLRQIESRGFSIVVEESQRLERLGAQITIPPNQA